MQLVPALPSSGEPSFWAPIQVGSGSDPLLTMCKLDWAKYHKDPTLLPMNRDLIGASKCKGSNSKSQRLSKLMEDLPPDSLQPTGMVFHESRCGSTLVADMLGTPHHHIIWTESAPPADIARRGDHKLLNSVMRLMCNSPWHTRCFFKMQSINAPRIKTYIKAFPQVPWAFVFREPVQTMMSHLKGNAKGVCLRSQSHPEAEHIRLLGASSASEARRVPDADFCAAHLAYLCESALDAATHATIQNGPGPGGSLMIPYDELVPMVVPELLGRHFGVPVGASDAARILEVSKKYSKGRSGQTKAGVFTGDNEAKEKAASDRVKVAAEKYLLPSTNRLREATAAWRAASDPPVS